ncbi:MAG: ATP-binding cassette domain-containing protein, partial [bacterium]|nr:ATP-binding cassette domain-containing protein [bacterium]
KGAGEERIEMQFLADVFVTCEACQGTRFQQAVQTVRYEGLSVIDFLKMTISDAVNFFKSSEQNKSSLEILKRLEPLDALGLGYLTLGQPLNTLSGGEAQRVKLSSYLLNNAEPTLFLLDEPTTGLHPHNVQQLLNVFDLLIDRGHSIVCIEHNLDVIRAADWIVEFGPGGGENGGEVIAATALPDYLKNRKANKNLPTWKALHSLRDKPRQSVQKIAGKSSKKTPLTQDNHSLTGTRSIHIAGARHHNLKNIALDIPHNKINVLTGVSGSGKSSLAFDIVFQEGQRRYIDCLSPYARQYIKQLSRADVDRVEGLPPTIAVSQKTAVSSGISTVATTTEIYQYLRLLYCKAGEQLCPDHNLPVRNLSAEGIADSLVERFSGKQVYIFAPVVSGRKGYHNEVFRRAVNAEIYSGRIDGEFSSFAEDTRLERHKLHWISLLVGNIAVAPTKRSILSEAISQALVLSDGTVEVCLKKSGDEPAIYSTKRVCPKCLRGFHDLDPQDFSFRSRRGKCGKCAGRGVIEQRGKTVTCPECEGSRLGTIGRNVLYAEKRIHELTAMNASELLHTLQSTPVNLRLQPVIAPIMSEVVQRLKLIEDIGLDYLRLDRESDSLSGGEAQRLRLATAVGSPLTGVCYVFDEPTIGLHASDHENLFSVFRKIRDMGNTLLIVEHDEDTILSADYLIDMGPGGGSQGGNVVAAGTPSELIKDGSSVTALCLQKRSLRAQTSGSDRKTTGTELVTINSACCNNLQHVDASFPAQALTVVAGLSGAGKSSLVHGVLTPAIEQTLAKKKSKKSEQLWSELILPETIKRLIEIDQSAIGKTPASTPASFLGVFDELRKLFASLPEAKLLGFDAGHFSYNSAKGRCPTCGGKGFVKVPMSFLPDAVSTCEECLGLRYKSEILKVTFQGLSIGEVLNQTFSDTLTLFSTHRRVKDKLKLVCDLGLGYIKIGQPTFTLSGGEAQRLKICRELASSQSSEILYILDEPTVGLHMSDVELLLNMLRALVERGNTVLVIEHNLDVIQAADHILEMGPGAGPAGGKLVFSGTPQELRKLKKKTATSKVLG